MDADQIICPNPLCNKQIPIYSSKCKYCETKIIRNDIGKDSDDIPAQTPIPIDQALSQPSIQSQKYVNLPKLEPTKVEGIMHGVVLLTPKSVTTATRCSSFSPQASIKVDLDSKKEMVYAGNENLFVYAGGLVFPNICPVTLMKAEEDAIFEVSIPKRSIGRVDFKAKYELRRRVLTALICDRYWLVVGFSKNHGPKDKAIAFEPGKNSFGRNSTRILLKNRAYAEEFARLNHFENGRWQGISHMVSFWMGILIFGVGFAILGGISLAEIGNSAKYTLDATIKLIILIACMIGVILAFFGYKGEKL